MANKPKIITDFFKSFTIPKNRIPRQDEDDEIIVASSSSSRANTRERTLSPAKRRAPVSPQKARQNDTTVKRGRGRPRKDTSTSPSKLRLETPQLEREESGNSTPTRRSPRKQMAGIDGVQDAPPDSSGLTSVNSSLKATPTKVRTVEAVEIPSPSKHSDPSMPAPSQVSAPEPRNPVNASFSSFSTLTSMSGMSSQSSSRRIVKNGVPAVTNSDSASMSSTSSEDELVDLADFAPRKKRRLTPPVADRDSRPDVSNNSKSTRSSTRLSGEQTKRRVKDSWRPPSPPPTVTYKHSLFSMAKQSAKEAASEAKIAQAEADIKEAEQMQKRRDNSFGKAVETKSMAKEFAQDSDEEERMVMAMERTEVLRGEETFYFFHGEAGESMQMDFPTAELDKYGLEFLQDDAKRQHACTSGFLAIVASQQGLPVPLVSWIHSEIFHEPSEEVCDSYVAILDALVKDQRDLPDLAFSLSETHPGQTLRDVEAEMNIEGGTSLPPNLKYALMATAALAPHIAPMSHACALAELIFLNNDENVRGNIDVQIHIEHAMDSIFESHKSDEDLQIVFRETTRQIIHATSISRHLLSRAIASIPATSLPLHQLRRKLSLHILLNASIDEDIDVISASTGVRLLLRLKKHSSFHISETTDYVTLHSLIDLLDIAIDVGFSDFAFLYQEEHKVAPPTKSLFGHAAVPQSQEEISFNAQMDDMVSHLRSMGSKIRDAGTSHLKRTEAKSALERLIVRLEAAVRTKPRPRKGVFDRGGAGSSRAGAMDSFLNRVESESKASKDHGSGEATTNQRAVNGVPGKQHKVTWRDDVVGMGDVGPGADQDGDESVEGNEDDDDDDDDSV